MSESVVRVGVQEDEVTAERARIAARDDGQPSLAASMAMVIGFWWAATGLTLAMQRSHVAGVVSVAFTSLCAAAGCALVISSRNETTVRSARLAFLGSSLVWWWCTSMLYAGVGVALPDRVSGTSGSFPLAIQAIQATLLPDLLGVAGLVFALGSVRRFPNRVALGTIAIFFCTLQTAKLNIFFGVRNAGAEWLPPDLAGLAQFFGPPHTSALLPVTLLILSACCVGLLRRYRRARTTFHRHSSAMLGMLMALALVEHIFLTLPMMLPLWNSFLPRS